MKKIKYDKIIGEKVKKIPYNNSKFSVFKKNTCIHIGLMLMKIYENFRDCSGIKELSEEIHIRNRDNEIKVEIVEDQMPKVVSKVEKLVERNSYLEYRITSMFSELIEINKYANVGDFVAIKTILSKYDLNKKLEY